MRCRDVSRAMLPPSSQVLAADGLAFAFVTKTGVGVSVLGGHGFVIRKVLRHCPSP